MRGLQAGICTSMYIYDLWCKNS